MAKPSRRRTRRPFIDFAHVRRHADLDAILKAYDLDQGARKRGQQVTIHCPFHDDAEPSCSISRGGKWHCFGCEAKGGSLLDFVAELEGVDRDPRHGLRIAAEKLAAICGITLADEDAPEAARSPQETRKRSRTTRSTQKTPNDAPATSEEPGEASPPALERNEARPAPLQYVETDHPYLATRGITPAIAERFAIGFYAGKGLMRQRIVFAIHDWWPDPDELSRLVAYAGRWPENDVPSGELRWKLPEGFKKAQVLYQLHRVAGAKHVHLVEGFLDAVHLLALKLPAVALMGRTISAEQVELLWRSGARYVTVLMDGDAEGRKAAPLVHAALGARGLFSRIVTLPDGSDPASLDPGELDTFLRAA